MVLNIDLFRPEKGGNPEKMRENQVKRYKDPKLVDIIVQKDEEWRKLRFNGDHLNKLKNLSSKATGEKMKNKEPQGDDEKLPPSFIDNFAELTLDKIKELKVVQLKNLSKVLDQEIEKNNKQLVLIENERNEALKEMGNILHESVPVTDNEDFNRVERTNGDCEIRKKYSHVDLVEFIDGFDGIRGAVVAGSRGYYTKGPIVFFRTSFDKSCSSIIGQKKLYTALHAIFYAKGGYARSCSIESI